MNSTKLPRTTQRLPLFTAATLSLFALFGLQACGGGGGGGTPAAPTLSIAAASGLEGNTGATDTLDFNLALSAAASSDVTVTYSTSDDTATTADSDYVASTAATLVIPAGETSGTISITVTGDDSIEADETFNLQISNAQNATIANNTQTVTGTIQSDDTLAGYYTGDSSIVEVAGNSAVDLTGNMQVIANGISQMAVMDITDPDPINHLVYIVNLNNDVSQTEFTATARIYKGGNFVRTTSVSGAFVASTSVELTMSGTGDYANGTITLSYSDKNDDVPLVFADTNQWQDTGPPAAGLGFTSNTDMSITTIGDVPSTSISDCAADSVSLQNVVSEQIGRIRSFNAMSDGNCNPSIILDGYITSYDTAPSTLPDEDRVLFIWFNDDSVHAASLTRVF